MSEDSSEVDRIRTIIILWQKLKWKDGSRRILWWLLLFQHFIEWGGADGFNEASASSEGTKNGELDQILSISAIFSIKNYRNSQPPPVFSLAFSLSLFPVSLTPFTFLNNYLIVFSLFILLILSIFFSISSLFFSPFLHSFSLPI